MTDILYRKDDTVRTACIRLVLCILFISIPLCVLAASEPELEFQRTVSDYVSAEGTRAVTYRVENTGSAPAQNIVVSDGETGEIARLDILEPDDYRQYTIDVPADGTEESVPKITWEYQGKSFSKTLSSLTIGDIRAQFKVSVAADTAEAAAGEKVTIKVYVRNNGTVPLYDIALSDEGIGRIGSIHGPLLPGETEGLAYSCIPTGDLIVSVRAQAHSATGIKAEAVSNTAVILVTGGNAENDISLSAVCDENGTVSVAVETEAAEVDSISVGLLGYGDVRSIAMIARGSYTFSFPSPMKGLTRAYVRWEDAESGSITVLSEPFIVYRSSLTGEIPALYDPGFSAVRINTDGDSIYIWLLAAGLGLLLALITMLILQHTGKRHRKRREKRLRDAKRARKRAEKRERFARTKKMHLKK